MDKRAVAIGLPVFSLLSLSLQQWAQRRSEFRQGSHQVQGFSAVVVEPRLGSLFIGHYLSIPSDAVSRMFRVERDAGAVPVPNDLQFDDILITVAISRRFAPLMPKQQEDLGWPNTDLDIRFSESKKGLCGDDEVHGELDLVSWMV